MSKPQKPTIRPELLDELLQGCSSMPTQEELFGPDGVVKQLSKMLIERCLHAEMTTHARRREERTSCSRKTEPSQWHLAQNLEK